MMSSDYFNLMIWFKKSFIVFYLILLYTARMNTHTSSSPSNTLSALSQAQQARLAFIDFRLYFLGEIARKHLQDKFGIAAAATTRDLALYKQLAPDNLELNGRSKTYLIQAGFQPLFDHPFERVMSLLSEGFGDGVDAATQPMLLCETMPILNRPKLSDMAAVTRAIAQRQVVRLKYFSHGSGLSERELVPFALVSDGLRWHARVFDRKRQRFGDFVITRMENVTVLRDAQPNSAVAPHERASEDHQWHRMIDLELMPHPLNLQPETVQRDFGMTNGKTTVRLRAAIAGYMLQQWHVDCSPDRHIADRAFRLCLADPLQLYGVETADIAPGYRSPQSA